MAESNQQSFNNEHIPFLDDTPDDGEFRIAKDQTFFNNDNYLNLLEKMESPKEGERAPSPFFPTLAETLDDEFSEFFYILNPISGVLEEAPKNVSADLEPIVEDEQQCSSSINDNNNRNCVENMEVVPAKKLKRELTVYEETLLKNFSAEIEKEQKLLAAEHEKKMQLWDLEMQNNQHQHAMKMAILKEQLEKIQQEKKRLELPQNLKHLSKFKSGPI